MKTSQDRALRVVEEAIHYSRLMSGRPKPDDDESFYRWLKASPEHLEALLIQNALSIKIAALVGAKQRSTLSQLPQDHAAFHIPVTPPRRRVWALAACVGALLLVGAPFVWDAWQGAQWITRETSTSSTRIPLTDHSTIQLYQHSEVRFRDYLGRPEVELQSGGASFKVERNDWRRFQVRSGNTLVTAIGTEFNVLRRDGRTGIYVINGIVRVQSDKALAQLEPGSAVSLSEDGEMDVLQPETNANKSGFLTAAIRTIAAELNRRQRIPQVVVEGEVAARQRITSSFSLDEPENWVLAFEKDPSLEIERRGSVVIVRARRAPR